MIKWFYLLTIWLMIDNTIPNLLAQSDVPIRANYDSTFSIWRNPMDTLSYLRYSGNAIYRLLNQELFIKKYENRRRSIDLRIRKSNFTQNDTSSIYKCCDQYKSYIDDYNTDYDKVKDLKFKVIEITPTDYYTNWHTKPQYKSEDLMNETFILTLKPNNDDPVVYYWFHPWTAFIDCFELNGYYVKMKNDLIGKKYVLNWIPSEYADKNLEITNKWECTDVFMTNEEFPKFRILLMDKKGNKTDLKITDVYPSLESGIYAEDKSDYFLKKYKKKLWEATLKRELTLGMPSELLLEIWRYPDNISKRQTKGKTTEKWDYSDGSYLVLENGKLTEIYNAND